MSASGRMSFMAAAVAPALLLAGVALLLAGIGRPAAPPLGAPGHGEVRVEGEGFPRELVGYGGRRDVIAAPPRRIVSLVLGADEILTRLVSAERLVAVSHFADDPVLSTCSDRVPPGAARLRAADPERLLSLEPDMVFAASYTLDSAVRLLVGAGVPVVRLSRFDSFEDVAHNVRLVAAAVGAEDAGERLVAGMQRRLSEVERRVRGRPRPRVLYFSPGGYTSGGSTLLDEKIRRAGGTNVVADAGVTGPSHLSADFLVALQPEVIVLPMWQAGGEEEILSMVSAPAWQGTPALRNGRVYPMEVGWLTAVSPDAAGGVERLSELLHPEAFEG